MPAVLPQSPGPFPPSAFAPAVQLPGPHPRMSVRLHNTPQVPQSPTQVWAHSEAAPFPFLGTYARNGTRRRGGAPQRLL